MTLGSADRASSRWPDEPAYREWLKKAQVRRLAPAAPDPTPSRKKKAAPVSSGGVVDWSAAARELKPSRR